MKKRRELDALIGNRAKNPDGQFEYDSLNSSLSSPTADVYMPPNYYSATKRISRTSPTGCGCTLRKLIRICLPVCFLSLVAACITACIGIVWMQVQLKTDVDKLKDQVNKLETWQAEQPLSMDDMKKTIVDLTKDLNLIQNGDTGIKNLAEKLALLKEKFEEQQNVPTEKLKQLESDSVVIKEKVDNLEATVGELKTQSSKSKSSQELLSVSYNKLKDTVDSIQSKSSTDSAKQFETMELAKQSIIDRIVKINKTVEQVSKNITTLDLRIELVKADNANALNKISQSIQALKQKSERQQSTEATNVTPIGMKQKIDKPVESNSRTKSGPLLRARQQAASTGISAEIEHEKAKKSSNHANETIAVSGSSKNQSPPTLTSLSGIASNLKANFEAVDIDRNSLLSKHELGKYYNERTVLELINFDSNKDGVLSHDEVNHMQSSIESKSRKDNLPGR